MSVIVWDGIVVASDRQAGRGYTKVESQKMRLSKCGQEILAWTGTQDRGVWLAQWFDEGADSEKWPDWQKPGNANEGQAFTRLIVVDKEGVREYVDLPIAIWSRGTYEAFGSGAEVALGALFCGADARTAVEAACRHSEGCGLGVDIIEIPDA